MRVREIVKTPVAILATFDHFNDFDDTIRYLKAPFHAEEGNAERVAEIISQLEADNKKYWEEHFKEFNAKCQNKI